MSQLQTEDDPKFLACCVLSENLLQVDFTELPHHPLEMNTPTILNGPTNKKSSGFKSGEYGGQEIGPPLPIHRQGKFQFRYLWATRLKYVRAPSCMKCQESGMLFSKKSL
jgi:hypothetical protein